MNSRGLDGALLSRFPKRRPRLLPEIERIYAKTYKANREGGSKAASLAQKMESWLHRKVAADTLGGSGPTLEIGAGTLNQLPYEPRNPAYDIVEPFTSLYENSPMLSRVRSVYANVSDIPTGTRYDRITSVAAFEHICELPYVVAQCGVLLNADGQLRVSIPSEGSPLWWLGWRLTTGLEFWLRHRLDYGNLMKHEHVNSAWEIEAVLRFFFADVRMTVFGLSRGFSLYRFYACSVPRVDLCSIWSSAHQDRQKRFVAAG
jgi:hypothetical protein